MTSKRPKLPIRPRQPLLGHDPHTAARGGRRLSDKIRVAFHVACNEGDVEIAERLLGHLEILNHQPPILPGGINRRQRENLVASYERLTISCFGARIGSYGRRQTA